MFLINANILRPPRIIKILLPPSIVSPQTSHFSSTPTYSLALPHLSRSSRSRAHQVAEQQQQQSQSDHSKPRANFSSLHSKSTQWPTHILKEAAKTGRLAMSAKVAEAVLNDFQKLHNQSVDDERNICSGTMRTLLENRQIFLSASIEIGLGVC